MLRILRRAVLRGRLRQLTALPVNTNLIHYRGRVIHAQRVTTAISRWIVQVRVTRLVLVALCAWRDIGVQKGRLQVIRIHVQEGLITR